MTEQTEASQQQRPGIGMLSDVLIAATTQPALEVEAAHQRLVDMQVTEAARLAVRAAIESGPLMLAAEQIAALDVGDTVDVDRSWPNEWLIVRLRSDKTRCAVFIETSVGWAVEAGLFNRREFTNFPEAFLWGIAEIGATASGRERE